MDGCSRAVKDVWMVAAWIYDDAGRIDGIDAIETLICSDLQTFRPSVRGLHIVYLTAFGEKFEARSGFKHRDHDMEFCMFLFQLRGLS